jgi:Lhr-like helicase
MSNAVTQLTTYAKIDKLKSFQSEAILSLFVGVGTLCLFPTGAGKTLCFTGVPVLYDILFNSPFEEGRERKVNFRPFALIEKRDSSWP